MKQIVMLYAQLSDFPTLECCNYESLDEAAKQREKRLQEREILQRDGRGRNARTKFVFFEVSCVSNIEK